MKRFIVTILCFVYVAATSGATINFHYCMEKFIGWDVAVASTALCDNCGMRKEEKKGCCNDKHTILQLKKDQLASNIIVIASNSFSYIQYDYATQASPFLFYKNDVAQLKQIPPLIQPVSTYILNNVFRI